MTPDEKQRLRADQFPITRNLIYLNHAAVGPLSRRAYEAMERHAADQRDFGAVHWRDWYAEVARVKTAAAHLIGATAGEISILKNTSEGMSFVASGFRWQKGDNVITTDMEFPSNYTPWKNLESRGVECRTISNVHGEFTVEDVERRIDPRTRIVSLSAVSFHNGFTPDLDAIGSLCASREVLLCVDAIQGLGVIPIDVRRSHISFLAADGHKWMMGPEGAAIFFCAAEVRDQLDVIEHGWTNIIRRSHSYFDESFELRTDGRRFEAGSLNTNGIYGLHAALGLLEEIGPAVIEHEVLRLASRLADGLESMGFDVRTSRPIRSGIISVIPPGPDGSTRVGRMYTELEREQIICTPREGMLRFSPHVYNDDHEIDRVIEVLQKIS